MYDDTFTPDFDLGQFRYAAACYVKCLIKARWKCDPGFLAAEDLANWKLSNIAEERFTAWQLLELAATTLARLNREFLPRCGSGGVLSTDEDTPEGRLIFSIAFLAETEGGGPSHNAALLNASAALKKGEPVDWDALVGWTALPKIRADLDMLPEPARRARYDSTYPAESCDESPCNTFRRTGDFWNLQFAGGPLFAIDDGPGPFYIRFLLNHAGKQCRVEDMAAAWAHFQSSPDRGAGDRTDEYSLADARLGSNPSQDDGRSVDADGNQKCKDRLDQIEEEWRTAERDGDLDRIKTLRVEKEKVAKYLLKSYRPGGRPIKVGDQNKKTLDRVTKAISRSIQKIQGTDAQLGRHFLTAISTGSYCSYAPRSPTVWRT